MTRQMATVLDKANTVKNWVDDWAESCPEWKVRLIESELDRVLHIIDSRDRRGA